MSVPFVVHDRRSYQLAKHLFRFANRALAVNRGQHGWLAKSSGNSFEDEPKEKRDAWMDLAEHMSGDSTLTLGRHKRGVAFVRMTATPVKPKKGASK